jgi:uncharacterized protein
MSRILLAFLAALLLAGSPAAAQGKRVALIIGMSAYQHLSSLENPVLDAKAIAKSLKEHGFAVSEHYDLPSSMCWRPSNGSQPAPMWR